MLKGRWNIIPGKDGNQCNREITVIWIQFSKDASKKEHWVKDGERPKSNISQNLQAPKTLFSLSKKKISNLIPGHKALLGQGYPLCM